MKALRFTYWGATIAVATIGPLLCMAIQNAVQVSSGETILMLGPHTPAIAIAGLLGGVPGAFIAFMTSVLLGWYFVILPAVAQKIAFTPAQVFEFATTLSSWIAIALIGAYCRHVGQSLQASVENRTLLINELNHRVKNTLATIQAIARLTGREAKDTPSFVEAFNARVSALAHTHNLLTQNQWSGAGIEAIIRDELEPYIGLADKRVTIAGDPVTLTARMAVSLGMAIHELATNAVKHGALAYPTGRLQVFWSEINGTLQMKWIESGRPEKPQDFRRRGFGTRLIRQTILAELSGTYDVTIHEDGVSYRISIPLAPPKPKVVEAKAMEISPTAANLAYALKMETA